MVCPSRGWFGIALALLDVEEDDDDDWGERGEAESRPPRAWGTINAMNGYVVAPNI